MIFFITLSKRMISNLGKNEELVFIENELAAASEAAKRAATAEETVTRKPRRRISDVVLPSLFCCRLQGESRIHK